ncbi:MULTISPECIES: hypothetical protein [unclassified Pseudodesulfovibrio]|uniref:hypothetical protein n=1 Tax=unclassified Pseudodesulfovibrio TaxID=2661612 RepID=UPI000FEBDE99|nr:MULTISPECIES: hypothetical protein [unclassified Pseudodesulfovibrio]MCJ2165969.1 hypothetical protein [Pseudodesulfovibrio sp. S3-i]RWU02593.1 hypothetical protein DWB63_15540 [Pseudodesulfovibrio sp. S3]
MNSILNSDKYTRTRKNTYTGETERQWLQYADETFEPVRKDGDLNRKFHGNKRTLDWWTVDKPRDWSPLKEGEKVSLNHDYGQADQPKKPSVPAGNRQQSGTPPRMLLAMGAQAVKDAGASSSNNASQAAGQLNQWEREQGIDPNQGSGHEQRPPSSARDAAGLKKGAQAQSLKEYTEWLYKMKNNPPWKQVMTPAEKVQGVTHPVGEEVGLTALQDLLKRSGPFGRMAGKVLGPVGIAWDVIGGPDDAW